MRHRKAGRTLSRSSSHRLALLRNLTRALIEHERIVTTVPKAKELRPFVERILTIAKRGVASGDPSKLLHARRLIIARLGPVAKVELLQSNGEPTGKTLLKKIFDELAVRYADRPGGYTRILKLHKRRLGDAGPTALIELLKAGETKKARKTATETPVAPAPRPAPAPTESAASEPATADGNTSSAS
jgi:large subunit ribosomal protein L17